MIEVRQEIGPAAEPHLGRMLHAAIRPEGTAVLVDLRHVPALDAGSLSLLRLARMLADRHGLPFGVVRDVLPAPALPGEGRRLTVRSAAAPYEAIEGRPFPAAVLPISRPSAEGRDIPL
ncbi:hypothetical protein [Streptomyces sp. S.PB5]|uniref:hypothetical protein n=1 Tax=Streptomyces sp. S.PB5 TaxID=3020844 RepID=UPI0025B1136A|nr:hypothetical protein [Streptomyces sp. S.PB5]MDN3028999.1 hypothetical protein [Streptomyces sp. S.PB5]